MEQQKKVHAAPQPQVEHGREGAQKEGVEVPNNSVLDKARMLLEKKKEEERKYQSIVSLINRNLRQMDRGEAPQGECVCM